MKNLEIMWKISLLSRIKARNRKRKMTKKIRKNQRSKDSFLEKSSSKRRCNPWKELKNTN